MQPAVALRTTQQIEIHIVDNRYYRWFVVFRSYFILLVFQFRYFQLLIFQRSKQKHLCRLEDQKYEVLQQTRTYEVEVLMFSDTYIHNFRPLFSIISSSTLHANLFYYLPFHFQLLIHTGIYIQIICLIIMMMEGIMHQSSSALQQKKTKQNSKELLQKPKNHL